MSEIPLKEIEIRAELIARLVALSLVSTLKVKRQLMRQVLDILYKRRAG